MTNFEKYKNEILALDGDFMFDVVELKFNKCFNNIGVCKTCLFRNDGNCRKELVKWLYEEAKPMLTQAERIFLEGIRYADNTYIVRFPTGVLEMSSWDEPYKYKGNWTIGDGHSWLSINPKLFPFITSEDDTPWKVSDLLKLRIGR